MIHLVTDAFHFQPQPSVFAGQSFLHPKSQGPKFADAAVAQTKTFDQSASVHTPTQPTVQQSIPVQQTQWIENKLVHFKLNRNTSDNKLIIQWDFVDAIDNAFSTCKIVTQLLSARNLVSNTLYQSPWEKLYDSSNNIENKLCMMDQKQILDLSNLENLNDKVRLLIDVQCKLNEKSESKHIGWTFLPIFIEKQDQQYYFGQGAWKTNLVLPPILMQASNENLATLPQSEYCVFFKIVQIQDEQLLDMHSINVTNMSKYEHYSLNQLTLSSADYHIRLGSMKSPTLQPEEDSHIQTQSPTKSFRIQSSETSKSNASVETETQNPDASITNSNDTENKTDDDTSDVNTLYDSQAGIGVLVHNLEHQSKYPIAKVRVSMYQHETPVLNSKQVWFIVASIYIVEIKCILFQMVAFHTF